MESESTIKYYDGYHKKNCRLGHEMPKINFLQTKGNVCDAVFDFKYKQFDFALFSVEAKIHVKANLPI